MKSIKHYLDKEAIANASLEHNDHIWLIDDYHKSATSALNAPEVTAILSLYLAEGFSIERSSLGKPSVVSPGREMFLSIAHSHQRIALLLSHQSPVGVDLELMRERAQRARIAQRFFTNKILSLSDFYEEWTAREALAKAVDKGIYQVLAAPVTKTSTTIGFANSALRYGIESVLLDQGFVLSACRALLSPPLLYFKARR